MQALYSILFRCLIVVFVFLTWEISAETINAAPSPIIGIPVEFLVLGEFAQRSVSPDRMLVASSSPNATQLCSPMRPGNYDRYHLPPTTNLPKDISFATDWIQHPTGGWYGQQIMDACRMQADGFLTWHGKAAVRVEVQPKDDPLALNANSERSEMMMMQDANGNPIKENKTSGIQYYATSYYFPATWRGEQMPWSSFAPTNCSTGDQTQCNSWSFVLQFYGWGALSAAATIVQGPERYAFNNSQFSDGGHIALGKWTDLVFMVNWNTGAYTVWRRDQDQMSFIQVLNGVTPPPSGDVYVKQGLYRGGNVGGRTDVLWIGPTARGLNFSSVEQQSFGTNNGPGNC